jgi:hypothetical protein
MILLGKGRYLQMFYPGRKNLPGKTHNRWSQQGHTHQLRTRE